MKIWGRALPHLTSRSGPGPGKNFGSISIPDQNRQEDKSSDTSFFAKAICLVPENRVTSD